MPKEIGPAIAPVVDELSVLSDRVRVLTDGDATNWRYGRFLPGV